MINLKHVISRTLIPVMLISLTACGIIPGLGEKEWKKYDSPTAGLQFELADGWSGEFLDAKDTGPAFARMKSRASEDAATIDYFAKELKDDIANGLVFFAYDKGAGLFDSHYATLEFTTTSLPFDITLKELEEGALFSLREDKKKSNISVKSDAKLAGEPALRFEYQERVKGSDNKEGDLYVRALATIKDGQALIFSLGVPGKERLEKYQPVFDRITTGVKFAGTGVKVDSGWKRGVVKDEGFAVQIPVGWTGMYIMKEGIPVLSSSASEAIGKNEALTNALTEDTLETFADQGLRLLAFDIRPTRTDKNFNTNLNVLVQTLTREGNVEEFSQEIISDLKRDLKSAPEVEKVTLPAGKSVVIRYRQAQGSDTLVTTQYLLTNGKRGYIFTFSTMRKTEAEYAPVFKEIMQRVDMLP